MATEKSKEYRAPFDVYAMLEHGGDYPAAAHALRQLGYGVPDPASPRSTNPPASVRSSRPSCSAQELKALLHAYFTERGNS